MQGFVRGSELGDFSHLKKDYDADEAADAAFRRDKGSKKGLGYEGRIGASISWHMLFIFNISLSKL
jgi:hypothetical protein